MSEENVELGRRAFDAIQRTSQMRSLRQRGSAPLTPMARYDAIEPVRRLVGFLAEDVVWATVFTPRPVIGPAGVVRTISEWIDARHVGPAPSYLRSHARY